MGCCTSLARAGSIITTPDWVDVQGSKTEDGQAANDPDIDQAGVTKFMDAYRDFTNEGGGDTGLGYYEVYSTDVPVMALASDSSEKLASLPRGTVVDVVGVCCRGEPLVCWGRIESPDGWIPLRHADSRLGQWVKVWGGNAQGAVASSGDSTKVDLSSIANANDGCDQVLCSLTGMAAAMSCNSCRQDQMQLPLRLRVESPNGQHSCEGLYAPVPGELPHGFPCWRLTPSASRWLYSTKSGIWCIGGGDVTGDKFGRSAGFIFQGEAHLGFLPHERDAPWHRWDGTNFVVDYSITVMPEDSKFTKSLTAVSSPRSSTGTGDQQHFPNISEASTAVPTGSCQQSQDDSPVCAEPNQPVQDSPMVDGSANSSNIDLVNLELGESMRTDVERRWHPGMPKLNEPSTLLGVEEVMKSFGITPPGLGLNCCHVESVDASQKRPADQITSTACHGTSRRSPLGSPRDKGAFPLVLCIESPNVHTSCEGFYVLVTGARPNGQPLWKKRGAQRWLFTGTDGKWYVGGSYSSKRKFKCKAGYLCHEGDQDSARPDRLQGPWSWGDATGWYPDADIAVRFAQNFELRPSLEEEHQPDSQLVEEAGVENLFAIAVAKTPQGRPGRYKTHSLNNWPATRLCQTV